MKNSYILLFLIIFSKLSVAQYHGNADFERIENKLLDKNFDGSQVNKQFIADELVGKTISDNEDDFYFVNNKYYVKIDVENNKYNYLGEYFFKIINGFPVIILNHKGSFRVIIKTLKNDFKFIFYNRDNNSFKKIKNRHYNEFVIDDGISNDDNIILSKNKLNVKLGEVWKPFDSIKYRHYFKTIYKDGKANIYDKISNILLSNCKVAYPYEYHRQVIDENNHMFFIDTIGNKFTKKPKRGPSFICGNYDSSKKWFTTYYKYKNKILYVEKRGYNISRKAFELWELDNESTKFFIQEYVLGNKHNQSRKSIKKEIKSYLKRNSEEELFFLKKIYKQEKYIKELSGILLSNEYHYNFIELPFKISKSRFINNNSKQIEFGKFYEWGRPKRLKDSYLIGRKNRKYGVWDIQTKKIVVPFIYNKIEINLGYLLLKKNNLLGYFPITGTAKYKFLGKFIEHFARFEYPNGKSGWIDRNGTEYFD